MFTCDLMSEPSSMETRPHTNLWLYVCKSELNGTYDILHTRPILLTSINIKTVLIFLKLLNYLNIIVQLYYSVLTRSIILSTSNMKRVWASLRRLVRSIVGHNCLIQQTTQNAVIAYIYIRQKMDAGRRVS